MTRLTTPEKDALLAPMQAAGCRPSSLWDEDEPMRELRGAGVVMVVCLFGLVFGLTLPFFVWLYLR